MEGWVGAADTQGSLSAQLAPHPPLLTLQDRTLPQVVCSSFLKHPQHSVSLMFLLGREYPEEPGERPLLLGSQRFWLPPSDLGIPGWPFLISLLKHVALLVALFKSHHRILLSGA